MATCVVSGTFVNPQGSAISGATVRFNLENPVIDSLGNLLMPKEITTTTAVDGTWSLTITQGVAGNLTLDLSPSTNSPIVKYKFSLVIPTTTTATFASCWADSATFGGQTTTSPLTFADISGTLATNQLPGLASSDLWVGSSGGLATAVAVSGDASLANTGALTVSTVGASSAANIHSAELLANAATNLNTASTLVKRDASGNFAAGSITASLTGNVTGNATTATTATSFSGSLIGDVTGTQVANHVVAIQGSNVASTTPTDGQLFVYNNSQSKYNPVSISSDVTITNAGVATVASVGGSSAANIHTGELLANTATTANTASAVVRRDASGNFVAGTITASQVIDSGLTASTVPYADSNKQLTSSSVTPTELGYLSGVTSAVQTQLNSLASGITFKAACDYATTAALPTIIYANGSSGVGATITGFAFGALSVDSSSPTVGKRILIKNQASDLQNGVYSVTATGSAGAVFILTRVTDFDQSAEMDEGSTFFVLNGTTNSDTLWSLTSTTPITVGSGSITFAQIAGPGSFTAGTGLSIAANVISLITPVTVANGGTGATTLTANNVVLGNGSSAVQFVAPGATGNVLTSDGSTWTSSAAAGGTGGAIGNINSYYAFT